MDIGILMNSMGSGYYYVAGDMINYLYEFLDSIEKKCANFLVMLEIICNLGDLNSVKLIFYNDGDEFYYHCVMMSDVYSILDVVFDIRKNNLANEYLLRIIDGMKDYRDINKSVIKIN